MRSFGLKVLALGLLVSFRILYVGIQGSEYLKEGLDGKIMKKNGTAVFCASFFF